MLQPCDNLGQQIDCTCRPAKVLYIIILLYGVGYWVNLEVANGLKHDTGLTPYGIGGVVMDRTERLQYR